MSDDHPLLIRANQRPGEIRFQHPLNENSEIHGHQLSWLVGLGRSALNLVRVPPGKESYVYHSHASEEEWVYVLSGVGIAEIEDQELTVGAGDFMGFPAPSVAHHLRNEGDEDLVYLCGGESNDLEVADYPRHGLRLIRRWGQAEVVPLDAVRPVG